MVARYILGSFASGRMSFDSAQNILLRAICFRFKLFDSFSVRCSLCSASDGGVGLSLQAVNQSVYM